MKKQPRKQTYTNDREESQAGSKAIKNKIKEGSNSKAVKKEKKDRQGRGERKGGEQQGRKINEQEEKICRKEEKKVEIKGTKK